MPGLRRITFMHARVTTSVIRLVAPPEAHWFADPSHRGELRQTRHDGRVQVYFPNFNFTTGLPEAVPFDAPLELAEEIDPSYAYPPNAGCP